MTILIRRLSPRKASTRPLKQAVNLLLKDEGHADAEVSILLTGDAEIQEMNLRCRGKDSPTDVLSFSMLEGEPVEGPEPLLGDVVISLDTALRQAMAHGLSLEQEMALLAVHGTLHLLGYEDETEEGAAVMRRREKEILGVSLEPAAKESA